MNIYNNVTRHLVIGPYTWEPWDEVNQWLSLPDSIIRKVRTCFKLDVDFMFVILYSWCENNTVLSVDLYYDHIIDFSFTILLQ